MSRAVHLDRLPHRRRRPEDLGWAIDAAEHDRLLADDRYSPGAEVLARDFVRAVTAELATMSEKNRVAYVLLKEEGFDRTTAARGAQNDGPS
jgi:DNA-directed RNA polymerase specialized sigma24 family protein